MSLYQLLDTRLRFYDDSEELVRKTESFGSTLLMRAPEINLANALSLLTVDQLNSITIEVYADVIALGDLVLPPSCSSVLLVARVIQTSNPVPKFKISRLPFLLRVYTLARGINLILDLETSRGITSSQIEFPKDSWGSGLSLAFNEPIKYYVNLDRLDGFRSLSVVDQLTDDGVLSSVWLQLRNNHLPRLLQYQILLASSMTASNPSVAYDMVYFVLAATAQQPKGFLIRSQAFSMAAYLIANTNDQTSRYVPRIDLSTAEIVLNKRLDAAQAFETAFITFQGQQDVSANFTSIASTTLDKAIDAQAQYNFLADLAESRYNSALAALKRAENNFQSLQTSLVPLQEAFKKGIEKWKKEQTLKAVGDALLAVVAVVGSIAAAVVVPPAGAAGLAAAGAAVPAAISGASSLAGTIKKIADLITKLKDLFTKIGPILDTVYKLVKGIEKLVQTLSAISPGDDAANLSLPASMGDDAINLSADWDAFDVQVQALMDPVVAENIDGASEYKVALTTMVIRAKATFAAQQALTTTSDSYITTLTYRHTTTLEVSRLRLALQHVKGSPEILRILKISMLEQLIVIRAWMMLDFEQYIAAYGWFTLSERPPIELHPLKEIPRLLADAVTLQGVVRNPGFVAQDKIFAFSSEQDGSPFLYPSADWLQDLRRERVVAFTVDINHKAFVSWSRIRLKRFRLFLDGAGMGTAGSVALNVSFEEGMRDRALERGRGEIVRFVTGRTVLGFEYVPGEVGGMGPGGESILMDGELSRAQPFFTPSPFRNWVVRVGDGVDVEGVEGLRMELLCEVSFPL